MRTRQITVYGAHWCPDCRRSKQFPVDQQIPRTASAGDGGGLPKALWRPVRTTNALENLNREFRRRTETQRSFATEAAGVTLLWALVASGQMRLRRINGYRALKQLVEQEQAAS